MEESFTSVSNPLHNSGSVIFSNDLIISKLTDFSSFFNSVVRTNLQQCNLQTDREQIIYLLLKLKKDIKHAVDSINNSASNKLYRFYCTHCQEPITVQPAQDIWETLTDHDHFEQMYHDIMNGKMSLPLSSESNTDSGIDQFDNEKNYDSSDSELEGDNTFRFNFNEHYDEAVEAKIYPSSIMTAIRKVDKQKEYTIQRAGRTTAICLICPCEMKSRGVSKFNLLDHAMGQRHLRAAGNHANITELEKYHDVFLREKPAIQAHQVYFRPTDPGPHIKCMLCNTFIMHDQVVIHILNDPHRKRVMDLFNKKLTMYYLINMQVKLYGVTEAQILEWEKEKDGREKNVKKESQGNSQGQSESETDEGEGKPSKHNIIKSIEHPETKDQLQLLPYRYKAHLNFIRRVETEDVSIIKCDLCQVTLLESVHIIMGHIRQSVHLRLSHLSLRDYVYHCDVCDMKFKNEDLWIKHFLKQAYKHKNHPTDRKKKFMEYECLPCKTVIYGDELSTKKHCTPGTENERSRFEKDIKLPNKVKELFKSPQLINQAAAVLLRNAEEVLEDNVTNKCCQRIEMVLNREAFDKCKVYPFGSRISGLGDKSSDLDVFVDTGNMYNGHANQDSVVQAQMIRKADKAFLKYKEEFKILAKVTTARTPIIKILHTPSELECDLSFRHGLSVENTKFLRFCIQLQPITQPLILLLKNWASHIVFDHITTYSLAMFAIFYLQVQGYLVSVQKIRELNRTKCMKIGDWEALAYNISIEEVKQYIQIYPNDIVKLLKEVFEYYTKFNYNDDVICPLLGHTIKKTQFTEENGKHLPKEMHLYVEQLNYEDGEYFRALSPLCIQDPFDLSHNLTKACQLGTVNKFKTLCELTLKHIVENSK